MREVVSFQLAGESQPQQREHHFRRAVLAGGWLYVEPIDGTVVRAYAPSYVDVVYFYAQSLAEVLEEPPRATPRRAKLSAFFASFRRELWRIVGET